MVSAIGYVIGWIILCRPDIKYPRVENFREVVLPVGSAILLGIEVAFNINTKFRLYCNLGLITVVSASGISCYSDPVRSTHSDYLVLFLACLAYIILGTFRGYTGACAHRYICYSLCILLVIGGIITSTAYWIMYDEKIKFYASWQRDKMYAYSWGYTLLLLGMCFILASYMVNDGISESDDNANARQQQEIKMAAPKMNQVPSQYEEKGNDDNMRMDESEGLNERHNNALNEQKVQRWLRSLGNTYYNDYYQLFIDHGWDEMNLIVTMNDEDLKQIGIDKSGHRRKIILEIAKLSDKEYTEYI